MINKCPHCQKSISLSDAQNQKIEDAFARLEPGGALKIGCPHCAQPIQLKKGGDGFLGSKQTTRDSVGEARDVSIPSQGSEEMWEGADVGRADLPEAPKAPDTSWLASGDFEEKEEVKDVSKALVLMPDTKAKTNVTGAYVELFYQVFQARTADEAIDQMRYIDFAAIVLHTGFEAGGLSGSLFHKHMRRMTMNKRRNIYYVLVGPEMHTFYDLEALGYSANLVVNDNDTVHMKNIIRKGLRDNDELFEPFRQALKALGKK